MKLSQQKSCCNIWYLLQWHILLQKPITTEFIATAKTYYHKVYCNGLLRLTFVAIKVYCNKMKVIATKNFVAINLFLVVQRKDAEEDRDCRNMKRQGYDSYTMLESLLWCVLQ